MPSKKYHHGDLKNALIKAGVEILAKEGVGGLSLRKVAQHAGVSHSAPYAHFSDKQNLIAAIASDGHKKIFERFEAVQTHYPKNPLLQLLNGAWAYMRFGLEFPDHYTVTFSGIVQEEHSYPEFIEYSQKNMQVLRSIVEQCRNTGVLTTSDIAPVLQVAVIWSMLHGLMLLVIQRQLPSQLIKTVQPKEMLVAAFRQIVRLPINQDMLD